MMMPTPAQAVWILLGATLLQGCAPFLLADAMMRDLTQETTYIDDIKVRRVVDADTGEPMEGVYVFVSWEFSGTNPTLFGRRGGCVTGERGLKTDKDGRFEVGDFEKRKRDFGIGHSHILRVATYYKPGYEYVGRTAEVIKMRKVPPPPRAAVRENGRIDMQPRIEAYHSIRELANKICWPTPRARCTEGEELIVKEMQFRYSESHTQPNPNRTLCIPKEGQ